jgi:hypothetical protein
MQRWIRLREALQEHLQVDQYLLLLRLPHSYYSAVLEEGGSVKMPHIGSRCSKLYMS